MNETPLFIPLKGQFFDAFAAGTKTTEYRRRGPRWNAETCRIGRAVILSRGYGKSGRLQGVIVGFHYDTLPTRLPGWVRCYGREGGDAACIKIRLPQHQRRDDLRETLRLFDEFRRAAPLREFAEELNQKTGILRSELACRDSLAKVRLTRWNS